ncbi:Zinc finger, FYVE domain containing 19 [Operophtera brumata]|uniref:Zinc finger, FYVE domain containing 19 n=1 Tax=Operophtera brumata TaxID=104452 RepID=A0A0L7KS53_OPEBR|nr:Zinc finger, FYVE domain containing 19 [Operophtera brumata]
MSCNGCYSSFSLLRPEKGCPSCGFSYCPKCLGYKVCNKCKRASMSNNPGKKPDNSPPDVFYKRLVEGSVVSPANTNTPNNPIDDQMRERLNKLKKQEATDKVLKQATDAEIAERLQKIKGEVPIASDDELHARLAKLRGTQPTLMTKDLRTEQEQVEDLMKQYLENTAIDCKYKDEFDSVINVMEARLQKLKGDSATPEASGSQSVPIVSAQNCEPEDEEESVRKIIEKLKAEALKDVDEIAPATNDELSFCEICNEDANMRCLGCRYLFCKRCFLDHRDDDDGCDKYEPYQPPKGSN